MIRAPARRSAIAQRQWIACGLVNTLSATLQQHCALPAYAEIVIRHARFAQDADIFPAYTALRHITLRRAVVAHIWEGVLPAVTTKFHADFSIDRGWTKKNIEAQIDAGGDGIIVCGSSGEA